jgi:ribonuclease T1
MDLRRIRQRWGKGKAGLLAAVVAAAVSATSTILVQARGPDPSSVPVPTAAVPVTALPVQGQQVMGQISAGGPFRYEKDGTVFFNREGLLPRQKRGYYREYTVPTPGLSHRGAKRIVCGGERPRVPDACYYTEDHYASFRRIVQ